MPTRKFYDTEEYLTKRAQLEHILFTQATKLELSQEHHSIQGSAQEEQYFIPAEEMALFSSLADFDCRTLKLINYARPAISLAYFIKHKYFVDKNPQPLEIQGMLEVLMSKLIDQRNQVIEDLNTVKDPAELEAQKRIEANLQKQLSYYQSIHNQMDRYQFAISNYRRGYHYSYVSYKYRREGKVKSANAHLIKHLCDKNGDILVDRANIIFVDQQALLRPSVYSNKQVDDYLNSFHTQIHFGKKDLYIK